MQCVKKVNLKFVKNNKLTQLFSVFFSKNVFSTQHQRGCV